MNMNNEQNLVQLGINPELIKPIINTHIKAAIVEAMGGSEELIDKVVDSVLNTKVNHEGKISNYSGDNQYRWLDVILTNEIRTAVKTELQNAVTESAGAIREALIAKLRTKAGADIVATALLDGLSHSFDYAWMSKIDISFTNNK